MNLLTELKAQLNEARRAQKSYKITTLSTLIGEIELNVRKAPSQEVTDELVNKTVGSTVKKFIENLTDNEQFVLENWKIGDDQTLQDIRESRAIYEPVQAAYLATLPQQLTDEQIVELVDQQSIKNVGQAMGWLKKNYPDQFDGARASAVIKQHLGAAK